MVSRYLLSSMFTGLNIWLEGDMVGVAKLTHIHIYIELFITSPLKKGLHKWEKMVVFGTKKIVLNKSKISLPLTNS